MRRRTALLSAVALVAGIVPTTLAVTSSAAPAPRYLVGGDVESINPTQAMIDARDFFLGGYGFGSGRVANQVEVPTVSDALGNRYATGILGDRSFCPVVGIPADRDGTCESDGEHTRAFAVSGGGHTIVLSQIETQGYFDAYKQGPFGINEIRKDASAQIAAVAAGLQTNRSPGRALGRPVPPVPSPEEIVVDSDHSHGGADTAGVWGGVPTAYLKLVHDRTVDAIVAAWQNMRPGTLRYGAVHGGVNGESQYPPQECIDTQTDKDNPCGNVAHPDWLLNNQFNDDNGSVAGLASIPNGGNLAMDDEVRVLQATDDEGDVIATYTNFSAHPTVLGSSNTKVTGDYVGRLDVAIEKQYGGFAMDQVATLGRTQPTDRGCSDTSVPSDQDSQNLCALDQYAGRVLKKIEMAVDTAKPIGGDTPVVAMNSYMLNDPTTSPVLAGVVYGGTAIGVPAARAANAPWYTGNVLGTSVFSGRIGDVLINGGPGEFYPQIVLKVRQTVEDTAAAGNGPAIRGEINIGTAGDFLGYIIAPLEAYPRPIQDSLIPPVGNDNYFFNISHTFGERLTCDLLRGAGDILANDKSLYWSQYDRCPAFANDYALDPGFDTSFPEQPDLSAVMTHM